MPEAMPSGYSRDGRWWWDGRRWLPVSTLKPSRRPSIWLAVTGSLLVLLLTGSLLTGLVAVGGGWQDFWNQATSDAQPGVHHVEACAAASFDQQSHTCKQGQASGTFQTDEMVCLANVVGNSGQQVSSSVSYQGHEVLRSSKPLSGSYAADVVGFSIAPGKALPGGKWSCTFSLNGRSQSVNFRLVGPTGNLLYGSACDMKDIVSASHPICKQSRDTIATAQAVACTAVVSGAVNSEVEIDLAYGGGPLPPFTRSTSGTVGNQLVPAVLAMQASEVGAITQMPAGHYTCRWLIDGHQVGQKDFQISG